MISKNEIYIIIPVFNEATVLESVVSKVLDQGYNVICIDDGSTDHSQDILKSLKVTNLKHRINLGQGAALNTGLEYCRRVDANYVATFDSDGQHNIEDLPEMLEVLSRSKVDIVLGSRFLSAESKNKVPFARRLLLRLARLIVSTQSDLKLTDAHNGYRLLSKVAIEKINFKGLGSSHASEIVDLIAKHNLKFAECGVNVEYTDYSLKKGQSFLSAPRILFDYYVSKLFK
ncbi:MAG: glycosyltransferase family 2 protein [Bdellovibrionales bacterium]